MKLTAIISACLLASTTFAATLEGSRPNIIFILTDDQGYGDLSMHGNPVLKTPNIDKLGSESLRFTNWHNSPSCSATRSALLTGRHEFRNGVTHTYLERERMNLNATTIAQVLGKSGYRTGIFGKWHLGDEDAYLPNARGFDETFIFGCGGIGQSWPGSCGDAPENKYFDPVILHNGIFEKTRGYSTDVFFAQTANWIASIPKNTPFFVMIPTNVPHEPYNARPEDRAIYAGKGLGEATENFFGMLHNVDVNIARLMAKLGELGIAENTLVVFMNDNGGTNAGVRIYNAGMRGAKTTPWIGGVRGISFWHWPGKIKPGDSSALTAHLDFFRTAAALAGVALSPELLRQSAEGRSLLPLLGNPQAKWKDRYLFHHVGRWPKGTDPDKAKFSQCTVRNTRYTLVSEGLNGTEPRWQLFDVVSDPGQSRDIASSHGDVVKQLAAEYDRWWSSLKGQYDVNEMAIGPKVNPFAQRYWKQFGGGPTQTDIDRMEPTQAMPPGASHAGTAKQLR